MATDNEETHRILGQIETKLGQIESSVENLQHDVSEIAGGLAVVLNRSEENKKEVANLKISLDASKKKHPIYNKKFSSLSNISLLDLQKTKRVLQRWKAQHQLPKM